MNNLTLYYIHQSAEDYEKLLSAVCDAKTEHLTVYSVFKGSVSPRKLQEIINIQKQSPFQNKVIFRNHAVFLERTYLPLRLRKSLRYHDFFVDLVFEDILSTRTWALRRCVTRLRRMGLLHQLWTNAGQQQQVYEAMKHAGLPIAFFHPRYNEDTIRWFDTWLYDPKAVGVNVFTDILSMLTLHITSRNCRYSSCIGKSLYGDADGRLYLCPLHKNETTYFGRQEDWRKNPSEGFLHLMRHCIDKRSTCSTQCDSFSYCQGGCPFEQDTASQCRHYVETVKHIQTCLTQINAEGRLAQVNPVVRTALLNAFAFRSP